MLGQHWHNIVKLTVNLHTLRRRIYYEGKRTVNVTQIGPNVAF